MTTTRRPGDDDPVIRVEGLTKRFGRFNALDGLDLEVSAGEVHGFLGPNGAGKSTTIRVLLGLLRATGGRAELFGRDPWTDALKVHHRLAYVPGDVPLWPGLTGGQCIDILTYAQGSGSTPHRDDLIERFELDPTKRTREYSKGNRQKVALVAAMSADVDLLVLDEPTAGLDPLMEQVFQDVVRERRNAGCTVLLSSHILGEVEALADRVTIIRAGRTVKTGSLAELRRDTRVAVHALTEAEPSFELHTSTLSSVETGRADGYVNTSFTVDPIELDAAIGELHRVGIHTLTVTPPSLDELFLQSYSSSPTGARHTEGEGQTGRRTAGQRYQGVGR